MIKRILSIHKAAFGLLSVLVLVAFVIGFAMARTSSVEFSGSAQYSTIAFDMPELVSQKSELFNGLMKYGHWDAELDKEDVNEQLSLENFHEYLILVGLSETAEEKEALFIVNANYGWQDQAADDSLKQIEVTADGRVSARIGEEITPSILIKAIKRNAVELSVDGQLHIKHLYTNSLESDSLRDAKTKGEN